MQHRLLALPRAQGEEFERTLVRYTSERLLYRLGMSTVRERCILKGASLLTLWMRDPYRATRDVDVLAFGPTDDAAIRGLLEAICAVPCPEDGLQFDLASLIIEEIRGVEEYTGKRARFFAYLGRARIRVQVDFGFGDALVTGADEVDYPTLVAGVPAPRIRAYPREVSVAEKFEAMVTLDTRNDFEVDEGTFDGAIDWRITKFTEFPQALRDHLDDLQGKTVVSFCTGGIRCEKAAILMREEGLEHVYQLDGGILKYFEETDGAHYHGGCFVFDERRAVDHDLQTVPLALHTAGQTA